MQTTVEQLTMGVPEEFAKYLHYCRNLMFEEKPDYNYAKSLFKQMMHKNGYDYDFQYDWILKKEGGDLQLKAMHAQEEKKVPVAGNFGARNGMRADLMMKEQIAQAGHQVISGGAGGMGGNARHGPSARNNKYAANPQLAEYANEP